MTKQSVLADAVRAWAQGQLPDAEGVAEQAARVALTFYGTGASVSESCREARRFVACWARHPANRSPRLVPVIDDGSPRAGRDVASSQADILPHPLLRSALRKGGQPRKLPQDGPDPCRSLSAATRSSA